MKEKLEEVRKILTDYVVLSKLGGAEAALSSLTILDSVIAMLDSEVNALQLIEAKTIQAIDLGDRSPVVEYCYLRASEFNINKSFRNKASIEAIKG